MSDSLNDPSHPDWRYSGSELREAKAERDAALAEVSRLREALTTVRERLAEWGTIGSCVDYIDAALAEGSDVLPTQRDH